MKKEKVDVIVNPTNKCGWYQDIANLKEKPGYKDLKPVIMHESEVGAHCHPKAENDKPAKKTGPQKIHLIGTAYTHDYTSASHQYLKDSIWGILDKAHARGDVTSISIPDLTKSIQGYDKDPEQLIIGTWKQIETCVEWLWEYGPSTKVLDIRLCNEDRPTVQRFEEQLHWLYRNGRGQAEWDQGGPDDPWCTEPEDAVFPERGMRSD